jgi:hypothetical protein
VTFEPYPSGESDPGFASGNVGDGDDHVCLYFFGDRFACGGHSQMIGNATVSLNEMVRVYMNDVAWESETLSFFGLGTN